MNYPSIQHISIAFFLACVVAGGAYWRRSLTRSGALAAIGVGTAVFGFGGWVWGVLLVLFFISSSLLSHFREDEKAQIAEKFDKGHQRDGGQVLANGGLAALTAILSVLFPSQAWFPIFLGILGTVTADTWATEIGTLSRRPPRLITTGRIVPPGTSGGVTLLGTAVSLAGGLLIGTVAGLLSSASFWPSVLWGAIGGMVGSLFDTLLGATVQGVYHCNLNHKETEKKFDSQGNPNHLIRGWAWLTNDWVNLLASCIGGLASFLLHIFWVSL